GVVDLSCGARVQGGEKRGGRGHHGGGVRARGVRAVGVEVDGGEGLQSTACPTAARAAAGKPARRARGAADEAEAVAEPVSASESLLQAVTVENSAAAAIGATMVRRSLVKDLSVPW
uniref:hypothetical protein n=1 Tax=Candidatus Frankia nodulisporulans TaxID=2060052 RepID=UPI001CDC3E69